MAVADITSSRAKLIRAREHRKVLDDEIHVFGAQKGAKTADVTYRSEGPWLILSLSPIPALPMHTTLVAGDCLNNTRAALDHLIWQLVLREGKQPDRKNSFPIYTDSDEFTTYCIKPAVRNGKGFPLQGIPFKGDAWTIIQKAQPFSSSEPEKNGLVWLQRLTNIDKHNSVFVQRTYAPTENLASRIHWKPNFQPIERRFSEIPLSPEKPTEIARFRFASNAQFDIHAGMEMDGNISITPCVGYGKSQVPIGTLDIAIRLVNEILDKVATLPRVQEAALQSVFVS